MILEDFAHQEFGLTGRVDIGLVEEIHASLERNVDDVSGEAFVLHAAAEGGPTAEGDCGYFQAGVAESSVFHRGEA